MYPGFPGPGWSTATWDQQDDPIPFLPIDAARDCIQRRYGLRVSNSTSAADAVVICYPYPMPEAKE